MACKTINTIQKNILLKQMYRYSVTSHLIVFHTIKQNIRL